MRSICPRRSYGETGCGSRSSWRLMIAISRSRRAPSVSRSWEYERCRGRRRSLERDRDSQADTIARRPGVRHERDLVFGLGRWNLGRLLPWWRGGAVVSPDDGASHAKSEGGAEGDVAQKMLLGGEAR